jgi:hypothetical protein
MPLATNKMIEVPATLFSALVQLPFDRSIRGIFDLECALLSIASPKDVIDGLVVLRCEATSNEHFALCAIEIRFLERPRTARTAPAFQARRRRASDLEHVLNRIQL